MRSTGGTRKPANKRCDDLVALSNKLCGTTTHHLSIRERPLLAQGVKLRAVHGVEPLVFERHAGVGEQCADGLPATTRVEVPISKHITQHGK